MSKSALAKHIIADLYNCNTKFDEKYLEEILLAAVDLGKATPLWHNSHNFGSIIYAYVMISESHLAIFAYPKSGIALVDVFTCGKIDPYVMVEYIKKCLEPNKIEMKELYRGEI